MKNEGELSHVDAEGRPGMVDVSGKRVSTRVAVAKARVVFPPDALTTLRGQSWSTHKGPVAQTAIIAATQAVKRTADLIPFCHPLPVEGCSVEISDTDDGLELRCEVRTTSRTGVEMEAWTGASVGALTIVDMCKALSPAIRVEGLRLVSKSGGKRDYREDPA